MVVEAERSKVGGMDLLRASLLMGPLQSPVVASWGRRGTHPRDGTKLSLITDPLSRYLDSPLICEWINLWQGQSPHDLTAS